MRTMFDPMKIYISADMEGIAGVIHRDETDPNGPRDYNHFRKLMTAEVANACNAAYAAGATEVWVKDAHWTGRNILPEELPPKTRLIRGWSGHPYSMVQELDSSFAAVMMIGYHSHAGSGANPLSHTMSGRLYSWMKLNGAPISEFNLFSYAASLEKVPVVFISGDQGLCEDAKRFNEQIETVATGIGHGPSMVTVNPADAMAMIRAGIQKAMSKNFKSMVKPLPEKIKFEVGFKLPSDAYTNSFFPGAKQTSDTSLALETENYFEVLRMLQFLK